MASVWLASCLALLSWGWAANIRSVPVAVRAGIPAVPLALSAPAVSPSLTPSLSAPGLNSVLPAPGAAPSVQLRPGLSLPAVAIPAAQASPETRNEGRTALERLSQDMPVVAPAPADLQGQKSFAEKSFDFKLGAESAEAPDAQLQAAPEASDTDGIGHRKGKKKPEDPSSNKDDGGGPDYPRGQVTFNGQSFDSVALRPNRPVEQQIISAIDASKQSIRLALYEFKLRGILGAVLKARRRGVKVEIILDYSNVFPKNEPDADYKVRRSNEIWGLIREGVDFTVLRGVTKYGINHNKFAIFDGKMAEFGSFNWSFTAENSHYENANFTTDASRIKGFSEYWDYLQSLSVPFSRAKDHSWPQTVPAPPAPGPALTFNGVSLPSYIFMPNGADFEDIVVKAIDAARDSVETAMFAMRSTRIAEALARARQRGLNVRVIMDESQSESEYFGPYAAWLATQGVEVRTLAGPDPDSSYPMAEKMHHKFMILDNKLVESGSANWTKRASMDNYENAHFLDDSEDVAAYAFAYSHMFSMARAYPKPGIAPTLPTDDELTNDILNPPAPAPIPPGPPLPDLPKARTLSFNGAQLPSYALLPDEPIEPLYVKAIDAAKKSLRMALYEFTSETILEALRRAKARGVKVELVLDRAHLYTTGIGHEGQPRKPKAQVVALAREFDMKVLKGQRSGVMHNKFMVFDEKIVSFGSFNLTEVAEQYHFENLMFSNDAKRVEYYRRYYDYMRGLAEDVDFDKLDEILNRTASAETESDTAADESADPVEAGPGTISSKFPPPPSDPELSVSLHDQKFPRQLFSPQGRIEDALIRAIKAAQTSIEIAMFSFYSERIAAALLAVRDANPGLQIRIVMDYSQSKLAKLDEWFVSHGFEVRLLAGPNGDDGDPMFEKMHNKMMIIDGKLLETGSFNYSPNAENNSFENANFIDDPRDLAGYTAYFQRLWLQGWKASPPKKKAPQALAAVAAHNVSGSDDSL